MARAPRAASIALAVAGCALLVAAVTRPMAGSGDMARELASTIEQRLREKVAALVSRVTTLSDLPRLASAVATDEATVRDLTDDELAFRPQPGETLTIAQRFNDGRTVHLLTLPPTEKTPMVRSEPGLALEIRDGRLLLALTARISPRERVGELVGLLMATVPVSLSDLAAELQRRDAGGRLEIDGSPLALAEASARASQAESALPVALPAGVPGSARLVLTGVGSGAGPGLSYGLGGAGALLLLLAVLLGRRGTGKQVEGPAPASAADLALTPTEFADAPRSPTPAPVRVGSSPGSGGDRPALALAMPAQARGGRPTRIGRYQILRQLGAGGMAEVYLARGEGEAGFEKLVALKLLQPTLALRPAVVEIFLDEARVAAGLNHPNIVQTQDLGRWEDEYFIAMEYIDGTDLSGLGNILRERGVAMPLPVAVAILRRVCDGLHAAHEAVAADGQPLGLVHRDVKAANVFVSRAGTTKIGDFGIAKIDHAMRVGRTDIGQVKGTPGYMAPEHRVGGEVDRRADVFGVAALAYELVSGQPVNLDTLLLIAQGLEGWPHLPPISSLRSDSPPALDALVNRGLAYDRQQRIPDCAVFEQELEAIALTVGVADDKTVGRFVTEQLRWAERQDAASAAKSG